MDNIQDEPSVQKITVFVYNYLINPINFNKSNKVALLSHPVDLDNTIPKSLEWCTLTKYISSLLNNKHSTDTDLFESVDKIFQSLIYTANKLKSCDIIIISDFNNNYNWGKNGEKLQTYLKSYSNINLVCIDCFSSDTDTELHDENIDFLNNSILSINENNENNFLYTIPEVITSLTKQSLITPKFKKPVEIYSYKLKILDIPDLEFNISAYPFVKRSSLTDYITSKSIDPKTQTKINEKYIYQYEDIKDDKTGEKELKEINNPELIIDGYKFGTSNFLITDLPNDILQLNSEKSMIITGFFPKNKIPPWYLKQDSLIILPYSKNIKKDGTSLVEKDTFMFTELLYSMIRTKVFATVRFVKKNGNDVKYGVLFPQGYVDKLTEMRGSMDFGCFIFVETIFKDDEKLVNLPNYLNMKIKDPKLQDEMDDLIDSYCIDKMDVDDDNDEIPRETLAVSMNEIPMNDMFYNLRQSILEQQDEETKDKENQTTNKILSDTVLMDIRKYNHPLMDFERLIYLCSYFILQQHLLSNGDPEMSLYSMYEKQGLPMQVINKWLDVAKEGQLFRPVMKKQPKK